MKCSTCANFRGSSHIIPSTPSYCLQPSSHFQLKFSVCNFFLLSLFVFIYLLCYWILIFLMFWQKLKRFGLVKNRLAVRCSSGSDEFGSANWLPFTPNKLFMQEVQSVMVFMFYYSSFWSFCYLLYMLCSKLCVQVQPSFSVLFLVRTLSLLTLTVK